MHNRGQAAIVVKQVVTEGAGPGGVSSRESNTHRNRPVGLSASSSGKVSDGVMLVTPLAFNKLTLPFAQMR